MNSRQSRNSVLCSLVLLALILTPQVSPGVQPYQPSSPDPLLEPWRWRLLPELGGQGLHCMMEAPDHSMWFGTEHGIRCYNGLEWTSFDPREGLEGSVEALCHTADGTIYAGGPNGICRFRQGQWTRVFRFAPDSSETVHSLVAASDGSLWAATSLGALHWRGSCFVLYTDPRGAIQVRTNATTQKLRVELLPEALRTRPWKALNGFDRFHLTEVYEDRQQRIWFGTEQGELLCCKPPPATDAASPKTWTLYNEADGLASYQYPHILQLTNGEVWVTSYGAYGRVNCFDGTAWKSFRLENYGGSDDSSSMLQTRDGALWIGCNGTICARRNGVWTVYQPPGTPIPSVRTLLLQSSDGALWIAGQDADVMRIDYQTSRWRTYQNLNFQWESPQGVQWFLERSGRIVSHQQNRWLSYGVEDGLIDTPVTLLGTRSGEIWVAGSHQHVAATARLDGQTWTRFIHGQLSWGVDWRATLESTDGSLWFGAAVDTFDLDRDYKGGVMQYSHGRWFHHIVDSSTVDLAGVTNLTKTPGRDPLGKFYGLAQSADGRIWGGLFHLTCYDGKKWHLLPPSAETQIGTIEAMLTTRDSAMWIGSRQYGVFRFDGTRWQHFHATNGLVANNVRGLAETTDGTLWVATDRSISRYDGHTWTSDVLPSQFNMSREGGSLKSGSRDAIWVNRSPRTWKRRAWPKAAPLDLATLDFWTICHRNDHLPPETYITVALTNVSQSGDLVLSWKGTDAWRRTGEQDLQYSFRMDNGAWSDYRTEESHSFFGLPSGQHHFEVRARNRDFNVDPTPAAIDFHVESPVWRQAWFLALMLVLGGGILTQSIRVIRHARHLRRTNKELAAQIEERKRIEMEIETTHKQLLMASHQAGMAEVATSVLHNVGNVLNSINVSVNLLADKIADSKVSSLPKVADLLTAHTSEPHFLSQNPKGRQIPTYLNRLGTHLLQEQKDQMNELRSLHQNIDHIREIITVQQEGSKLIGFAEAVPVSEMVESALRLNGSSLARRQVRVTREMERGLSVVVEKHKVLQILVNLIRNAEHACDESGHAERQIILRSRASGPGRVQIQVQDNGVGIRPENLTKIFGQGFTTRKTGHGFGLHSAANAAAEMGGSLTVQSAGVGKGATFTLEIPTQKPADS